MIQLQLTHALALYAGILGVLAIAIWIYTEVSVRRPQRAMGKQFLWHCTICGYSYLDESATELSECPQCKTILSAKDPGAREVVGDTESSAENAGLVLESAGGSSRRKRPGARRRGPRRRR